MIVQSIPGLAVFILFAWLMSENRKEIPLRTVIIGLATQLAVGAILFIRTGSFLQYPFMWPMNG